MCCFAKKLQLSHGLLCFVCSVGLSTVLLCVYLLSSVSAASSYYHLRLYKQPPVSSGLTVKPSTGGRNISAVQAALGTESDPIMRLNEWHKWQDAVPILYDSINTGVLAGTQFNAFNTQSCSLPPFTYYQHNTPIQFKQYYLAPRPPKRYEPRAECLRNRFIQGTSFQPAGGLNLRLRISRGMLGRIQQPLFKTKAKQCAATLDVVGLLYAVQRKRLTTARKETQVVFILSDFKCLEVPLKNKTNVEMPWEISVPLGEEYSGVSLASNAPLFRPRLTVRLSTTPCGGCGKQWSFVDMVNFVDNVIVVGAVPPLLPSLKSTAGGGGGGGAKLDNSGREQYYFAQNRGH